MKHLVTSFLTVCCFAIAMGTWACDCPDDFEPVCAIDEMGFVLVLPNACVAECEGLEIIGDGECEETPFDDCEEVACIADGEGNYMGEWPICLAELIFPDYTVVECEEYVDPYDCGCEELEYEPVCVDDGFGGIFEIENACWAECYGYEIVEGDCGYDYDDDWGDWNEEDCDEVACIADSEGNYLGEWEICVAELFFPDYQVVECEEYEDPYDCGCEEFEYEPVCVEDDWGYVFEIENACWAECYGLTIVGEGDCGYDYDDDFGDDWNDEDCEEVVCLADGEGNYLGEWPVCLVDLFFPDAEVVDCEEVEDPWGDEDPFGDCDCDFEDYSPVCVSDEYGFVFVVENACVADCFGLEVVGEGDCDYGDFGDGDFGDDDFGDWNEEDCEEIVCVVDGEGFYWGEIPLCLVEELFPDAEIVDCEEVEDPWGDEDPFGDCDCEDAEYAPVCVTDEYGFVFVVENACVAECFGLEVVGEGDCDYGYDDDFGDWGDDFGDFGDDLEGCDEFVCVVDCEGNYIGEVPICLVEIFPGAEIVDCEETPEDIEGGDINVEDLQDFGDWVYNLTGDYVDHDGGFFIESAYPNPTDDIATLVVKSDDQNVVNLTVVDINGKLMFDQQVVLSNGSMRIELPFNQMPAGMFFVNLIDNNGNQESVRIVNNK